MKLFRTILIVIFAFAVLPARAQQSAPNWTFNYVPTPAEWSFWFGKKVDFAGALPCIVTGCVFSGNVEVTGTSVPVVIAGDTWIAGQIGAGLTLVAGSGIVYNSATGGLVLQGKGSSNDVAIRNSAGSNALSVTAGTFNVNMTGPLNIGSTSPATNGLLNLTGSTSGGATIGVSNTGVLSIATAQGNGTFINDGGNGSAFIIGSAGGAIANRISTTPSLTGFGPSLSATGSDTNVTMRVNTQAAGGFLVTAGGGLAIDGNTPTSCSSTGSGTGPSCALEAGSNNSVGRIQITTGTTPGSSGTFTITFANVITGANNPVCMFLYNDTGTAWNAGALPMHLTSTSTSVITATWNNTAALTASSGYKIDYHCFGK